MCEFHISSMNWLRDSVFGLDILLHFMAFLLDQGTCHHQYKSKINTNPPKCFFPLLYPGARPFPCPHCDKIFRTSGHRKTHIASHFKNSQQKKHKFPRKANKAKVSKSNLPLPDIPLQEPILITDFGKILYQRICGVDVEYVPLVIYAMLSAIQRVMHHICL